MLPQRSSHQAVPAHHVIFRRDATLCVVGSGCRSTLLHCTAIHATGLSHSPGAVVVGQHGSMAAATARAMALSSHRCDAFMQQHTAS
jgi:hypothetical protein